MKQSLWLPLGLCVMLLAACGKVNNGKTAVSQIEPRKTTVTPTRQHTQENCPITQQPSPRFVPPEPYPEIPPNGEFWVGADVLWTALWPEGNWHSLLKSESGYVNKMVWFREGYDWTEEQRPQLAISARRLDGEAIVGKSIHATNGFHPDYGAFMLTSIELPTLGCWEITGDYEGHTLSFVVWVMP